MYDCVFLIANTSILKLIKIYTNIFYIIMLVFVWCPIKWTGCCVCRLQFVVPVCYLLILPSCIWIRFLRTCVPAWVSDFKTGLSLSWSKDRSTLQEVGFHCPWAPNNTGRKASAVGYSEKRSHSREHIDPVNKLTSTQIKQTVLFTPSGELIGYCFKTTTVLKIEYVVQPEPFQWMSVVDIT